MQLFRNFKQADTVDFRTIAGFSELSEELQSQVQETFQNVVQSQQANVGLNIASGIAFATAKKMVEGFADGSGTADIKQATVPIAFNTPAQDATWTNPWNTNDDGDALDIYKKNLADKGVHNNFNEGEATLQTPNVLYNDDSMMDDDDSNDMTEDISAAAAYIKKVHSRLNESTLHEGGVGSGRTKTDFEQHPIENELKDRGFTLSKMVHKRHINSPDFYSHSAHFSNNKKGKGHESIHTVHYTNDRAGGGKIRDLHFDHQGYDGNINTSNQSTKNFSGLLRHLDKHAKTKS